MTIDRFAANGPSPIRSVNRKLLQTARLGKPMHVWRWMACSSAAMVLTWCVLGTAGLTHPWRTVQEHFLGIPAPLLPLGTKENRLRYLRYGMVDEPNGYIRYQASDNPERFEFAIFRKRNGRYLAAFSTPYDPNFFDRPIPSQLLLLDYRQGQWRDVTREHDSSQ